MSDTALILAAGRGTRMRSRLAKVLHPLCGRPMAGWVVRAAEAAGCATCLVVGHDREAVLEALKPARHAVQAEQLGTGHAVACAAGGLPRTGRLLVLAGDTPLLRPETLEALLDGHGSALCTVLTAEVGAAEATRRGYGRVVREGDRVARIVEHANASEAERALGEINTGVYAFDAAWLLDEVVPALKPHPPKGEYYLPDAVAAAAALGRLSAVVCADPEEVTGVNDRAALADATAVLRARIARRHLLAGVTLEDPTATWIDDTVVLAEDVTVEAGVVLRGSTRVGRDSILRAHSVLEDAVVGEGVSVGPFARLRQGTVLGAGARVGNFVETKNARLAEGVKAGHLSYLGDCAIGPDTNVGAGTITCNYDGFAKHHTAIGAGVFVGSNTALVAPVSVGDGALVGAGSVITADVPGNALALGRGRQAVFEDRAETLRELFRTRSEGDDG